MVVSRVRAPTEEPLPVSPHQSNPTSLDSPPVLIQQSISSLSHSSAWTQLIIYHLHTITLLPYVWDIFVDSEC